MKREDFEIRNQQHLMDAEGCQDVKPTISEIEKALINEGYQSAKIDIFFDDMMWVWRWSCDITRI